MCSYFRGFCLQFFLFYHHFYKSAKTTSATLSVTFLFFVITSAGTFYYGICCKEKRSSNFSENEKTHFINIVAKPQYKNIIENKGTDKTTNIEKNLAWEKAAAEFNATSATHLYRSKEVLKRFYENKKKEVRKKVADVKIDIKKTGGGPPAEPVLQPFEDVLLSITNRKTVFGLNSKYGGDVSSDEGDSEEHPQGLNDVEIIYEFENGSNQSSYEGLLDEDNIILEGNNWQKYKPSDLSKPISVPLRNQGEQNLAGSSKEIDISVLPGPSNYSTTKIKPLQQLQSEETPKKTRSIPASDRRRPNIQVKALTSSEVSQKYNQLLDMRLEIADYTKKPVIQEIDQANVKHLKEMELLDVQLSVEKERLNRLRRNDY